MPNALPRSTLATRDRILEHADELLARYGYSRMTIDDIARAADIGKGSVYLHFASKRDLVLALMDRLFDRVVQALEQIAAESGPADDRLRRMLVARSLVRLDGVSRYREGLDELLTAIRPALAERWRRHGDREAAVLARVLAAGNRAGIFAAAAPLAVARLLMTATNALVPSNLAPHELGRRTIVAQRAKRLSALLLDGVRAR